MKIVCMMKKWKWIVAPILAAGVLLCAAGCSSGSGGGDEQGSPLTVEDGVLTGCDRTASGAVEIPEGVTSVGAYAFSGCTKLTQVVIPSTVVSVGDSAFSGCTGLTSVTIPNGVEHIGNHVFSGCSRLTAISIPASVTWIESGAFGNCSSLRTVRYGGTKKQWGALNVDTDGISVECRDGTFSDTPDNPDNPDNPGNSDNPADEFLTIENGVLVRCEQSATGTIEIPSGVTAIGESAFFNCDGLTSVIIPEGVRSIGANAFDDCDGLTSITIPESVSWLDTNDFSRFSSLRTIYYGGSRSQWNMVYFFDTKNITVVYGKEDAVSDGQYGPLTIESLVVKKCDTEATGTVEIPDGVISIESYAFSGCEKLTSVAIPSSVTSIGWQAFGRCIGLTSVEIPSSVTFIEMYAFSGCSGLTSITIPESVASIGDYAFQNCGSLNSITIPASVTSIGTNAFVDCNSLATVYYGGTKSQWNAMNVSVNGSTLVVCAGGEVANQPDCLTVQNGVVVRCDPSATGYIEIGGGVTAIADGAFSNCTEIKGVVIPEGVTSIGSGAFRYCSGMLSLEIPASVETVGYGAFEYTQSLATVNCSGTVAQVAAMRLDTNGVDTTKAVVKCNYRNPNEGECHYVAKSEDKTLTGYVVIPKNVTEISGSAFSGCDKIVGVGIPASVTAIGGYAFSGCNGLTSITIPASITSIETNAFENFYNLEVDYTGTFAQWISLDRDEYDVSLVTVDGKVLSEITKVTAEDLAGATKIGDNAFYRWDNLRSVEIPNSVTSIGGDAFLGCSGLTTIAIPNSVTSIGSSAFLGCSGLTTIAIPNSVTSIGSSAFSSCSGLTSITIPDSVTSIEEEAFYHCSGLTTIVIPNGVWSIRRYAFSGCSGLTSVTIPISIDSISEGAFYWCDNLKEVLYGGTESDWTNIRVLSNNSGLLGKTIIGIDGSTW